MPHVFCYCQRSAQSHSKDSDKVSSKGLRCGLLMRIQWLLQCTSSPCRDDGSGLSFSFPKLRRQVVLDYGNNPTVLRVGRDQERDKEVLRARRCQGATKRWLLGVGDDHCLRNKCTVHFVVRSR